MKFLVDMPLSPGLAVWLRDHAHDAVLDYPHLLALSRATEPGVILFRDGEWSEASVINRMAELLAALPESDLPRSIVVVEKDRIRRRRLPLR